MMIKIVDTYALRKFVNDVYGKHEGYKDFVSGNLTLVNDKINNAVEHRIINAHYLRKYLKLIKNIEKLQEQKDAYDRGDV